MKWLAPAFVALGLLEFTVPLVAFGLLQFTAPNGRPVYFSPTEIIAISDPATCSDKSGSRVMTSMGSFCILESVEKAVSKYQDAVR